MSYTAGNHVSLAAGASGGTTSSIDTTGANLLIIAVAYRAAGTSLAVSDSKGNTWTALTAYGASTGIKLWYCQGGTVGTGHTFTVSGSLINASIAAMAFSGSAASPADQQNGFDDTSSSNSTSPGSITPSQDNCLVITALGSGSALTGAACSGYTIVESLLTNTNSNRPLALAYAIQTTATATNPAWSWTAANAVKASTVESFKAASSGGGAIAHILTTKGLAF